LRATTFSSPSNYLAAFLAQQKTKRVFDQLSSVIYRLYAHFWILAPFHLEITFI
jgi:hypothetical protein